MSQDDHSPLVPGSNAIPCQSDGQIDRQLYISGPSVQLGVKINKCIDAKLPPLPDKIYIQIDGASVNTGHSVFAALEHLVGASENLPVGHTHEEIDGRFAILWR